MTIILLVLGAVILFFLGVISPRRASKIQSHTKKESNKLKRAAEWLWNPVTWWAQGTTDFIRKIILAAIRWGKKTRKKLPF